MTTIMLRRGTASEWTAANPTLFDGEMGVELDTARLKFGNGVTPWNGLEYHFPTTDVQDLIDAEIAAHVALPDPHPQYLTAAEAPAGGSVILSGTATPTGATGNPGDYYLDTDDRMLYGPKVAAPFGPAESMIATTPVNGASQADDFYAFGMRFQVLQAGRITGLRFWRSSSSSQTSRSIKLWSDAGGALGTATTAGESGSGWQTAMFATPVAVTAGTYYRVAYDVSLSNWSVMTAGTQPVSASGKFANLAGYFATALGAFPNNAAANNRFCDVIYEPSAEQWPVALKSVPPGGTTAQVLNKTSATDYAAGWASQYQVTHPNTDDVLVQQWDSGKGRWQTVHYDSGWRQMSGALVNGWTGKLVLKKVDDVLLFQASGLDGVAATNRVCLSGLPPGFRAATVPDGAAYGTTSLSGAGVPLIPALLGADFCFHTSGPGYQVWGATSVPTEGMIPTSLPGTLYSAAPA